jgi:hypothetical protein
MKDKGKLIMNEGNPSHIDSAFKVSKFEKTL